MQKTPRLILPKNRPLNENDIYKYCRKLRHFRGVFCKENIPKKPWKKELTVLNLDSCKNGGTHWVALASHDGKTYYYYDPFGNLRPSVEIEKYLKGKNILFNYKQDQSFGTFHCGHFVLKFIQRFHKKHFC